MYTETTPILRDSQFQRNNNEVQVQPYEVVRERVVISHRQLAGLLASVAFFGCLAVFAVVSFQSHPSGIQVQMSPLELRILSATSPDKTNKEELTLESVYELAKRVGSSRLPEDQLKQLEATDEVCTSKECLEAASSLLRSMNFSVHPCDDFYQFSCGQWIADNKIPESESRWNQFNVLRDRVNKVTNEILTASKDEADALPISQVKDFYKLCTDTAKLNAVGLNPLRQILKTYGDWPLLSEGGKWNPDSFNWLNVLADTTRRFQTSSLISVSVDQDWKNTDKNIIYIDQPSLMLPRTMLVDETHAYDDICTAYETYISKLGAAFVKHQDGEGPGGPGPDSEALKRDAKAVVEFEKKLARITSKDEDRTDNDRMYNKRVLAEYQSETGVLGGDYEELNWKTFLDSIFSSSGVTIEADESLIVPELNYLKELVTLLRNTPKRDVANYVHFRLADHLLGDTTEEMRSIKFKFNQMLTGAKQPKTRAQTCADDANSALGMAIGVKYVEKEFDDTSKSIVNDMVENLRAEYSGILANLSNSDGWMDEATCKQAQQKLSVMKKFMAYPDWLGNKSRVEELYRGLVIGEEDHLTNVERKLTWSGDANLKKLRKPVDREFWLTYPGVVNAFYSPTHNSITFPAGIHGSPI